VTRAPLRFPRLSRQLAASAVAGLMVSTIAAVAVVIPTVPSSAQGSSAPTASIQVWTEASGTPVDNYWAAQAKAFDQANPGDSVSIDIEPSGSYNTCLLYTSSR